MQAMRADQLLAGVAPAQQLPQLADVVLTNVVTDSRLAQKGCLFAAICGQRTDGHDHAAAALAAGAALVMGQRAAQDVPGVPPQKYVRVPDVLQALIDIGANYRAAFSPCVVGVTGSVGKTTTKEFLAAVLAAFGPTLKTQGNHNNEIGVPATLLGLTDEIRYAVVEMGMQGLGEISRLARAVRPQAAIITCIGTSHLEQLGSRENILRAKMEICEGLPADGLLVLNGDDSLLSGAQVPSGVRRVAFGVDNRFCPVCAQDIRPVQGGQRFEIQDRQFGPRSAFIPAEGRHNVYDALAAYTAATRLGLDADIAARALGDYHTVGHRQHVVMLEGICIVEDCYNANPESMRAALTTLREAPVAGRRIAVLGDMLELGAAEADAHTALGKLAAACGVECLVCYGTAVRHTAAAARAAGVAVVEHAKSHADIAAWLAANARPGDRVLVKGSHGMALEEALALFYAGREPTPC